MTNDTDQELQITGPSKRFLIPPLTNDGAARAMGIHRQTLRNWRSRGRGPAYYRLGRRVYYRVEDIESYLRRHRVDPEIR